MVGVYDKATNTVTFRRAPLVRINTVVKSLKSSRGVKEHDISNRILEARNELGEKFGNKKRKAQIRAEERNRINMDQIQGSAGIISTSIEARTTSMPTSKDLADEADQNRPLPNYDSTTTVPADVYDMEDVLSKAEALHINVSSFVKAKSPDDYKRFIPVQSTFVSAKVDKILDSGKPNLALLRRALFLAYLMKFATMRGKATQSRDAAAKQMRCAPEIADVIFEKFAECVAGALNPDGSPVYKKTPGMDNKLICYIAILMLSLNEWIMYPSAMAADLGMPTKKAEKYLESVGCKLEAASKEEIARFSSGKRATGAPKKAVLKAP
ncbi:DNA-directed RNA polymerase I subunit rpa49, partial [Linderina pennispora]